MERKEVKVFSLGLVVGLFLLGCTAATANQPLNDSPKEGSASSAAEVLPEEAQPMGVSEFILGPGDKLDIMVYRNEDLARTVLIDPSGMISLPLVGDIRAAGVSVFELRDRIREGLSRYIVNPQVTVGVVSTQSQKVTVLGEVRKPGFFQAEGVITVLDAISYAGGFTLDGKTSSVLLIRGGMKKPELVKLDLLRAITEGDLSQDMLLRRGDIVYVPRTTISNVDRFFSHLSTIISPLLSLETGYFIGQQIESNGGTRITVPAD